MNAHWTQRSTEDYVFAIGADYVAQLEDKMEAEGLSQKDLSEKVDKSEGRVSQVLNRPGNLTLTNIVRYSRALGMKASIIAYEDDDPENKKGPINSSVFRVCWERCGKPSDLWDLEQQVPNTMTSYIDVGEQIFIGVAVWPTYTYNVGSFPANILFLAYKGVAAPNQDKTNGGVSWNQPIPLGSNPL